MKAHHISVFCLLLGATAPAFALQAEQGKVQQAPMMLMVEVSGIAAPTDPVAIAKTAPGVPVKIIGVVGLSLAGKSVAILVTPPQKMSSPPGPKPESKCPPKDETSLVASGKVRPEPPTTLAATVDKSGTFEVTFSPKVTGRHDVMATVEGVKAVAKFDVTLPPKEQAACEDLPGEELQREADRLVKNLYELTKRIRERVQQLPNSPAKDEFMRMLHEFEDQQRPAEMPDFRPHIVNINDLRRHSSEIHEATREFVVEMKQWLDVAKETNRRVGPVTAQLTTGNVLCDDLDIIINGLKFCSYLLGLATEFPNMVYKFYGSGYVMNLVNKIPPVKRSPVLSATIGQAWKIYQGFQGVKPPKATPSEVVASPETYTVVNKMAVLKKNIFSLTTYAANRIFEQFCEEFRGKLTGGMTVEFYEKGKTWWTYTTLIDGELILRYPKGAEGPLIRLSGEFLGNAKKFVSKDSAIPVLFPELSYGTIIRQFRLEPFGLDDLPNVEFVRDPIMKGGAITRYFVSPAPFRVPVKAEMTSDDKIRLELQPATVDFDDRSAKVYNILGPVLSLQPWIVDYVLPYKGAHFILLRAMNDGPVVLEVKRDKNVMRIERTLERIRETRQNKGIYKITVNACNPGSACN